MNTSKKFLEFYFRNLFNNSMLSMPICYFEINFNFNISKNLCQFARMSPEFTDSLFIWTDFTQGTDAKKDADILEVSKNIPSPPQ